MTHRSPTSWVSGERVFAPPNGTLDPDWLVPALLEARPALTPEQARVAVVDAWTRHRSSLEGDAVQPAAGDDEAAADAVVAEAVRAFRA